MKTPEQLKGAIRNLAKEKGIHAQEVLQIFMFERIIEFTPSLPLIPKKRRLESSKTGGSRDSKEKGIFTHFAGHKAYSASVERINRLAGLMEKVPGTKFICKRDYISFYHRNRN